VTAVPTKGAVLEWARNFRGLSQRDASERLGITVDELAALEDEKKQPTVTLFEAIAAAYRLPQATLFLASPPPTPNEPIDFRTVQNVNNRKHSFEFKVALSNIRTWLFYAEKVAGADPDFAPPDLPHLTKKTDASDAGEQERKRLGISIEAQLEWEPRDTFGHWRAHLESRGVLVFQQKFPMRDGRGFSIYETENAPAVIINKEEIGEGPKAFTVWHEYCHLLLREPGVSDEDFSDSTEAYCNRFAAAFLIPTEALRRLLPHWPNEPVEWSPADIGEWARQLKVSRHALTIRLEQLGLAPNGFSRKFAWTGVTKRQPTGGGNYIATRFSELGGAYTDRLLAAYDRKAIDAVQLVEAVGLDAEHIPAVRKYVARSRRLAGVP